MRVILIVIVSFALFLSQSCISIQNKNLNKCATCDDFYNYFKQNITWTGVINGNETSSRIGIIKGVNIFDFTKKLDTLKCLETIDRKVFVTLVNDSVCYYSDVRHTGLDYRCQIYLANSQAEFKLGKLVSYILMFYQDHKFPCIEECKPQIIYSY